MKFNPLTQRKSKMKTAEEILHAHWLKDNTEPNCISDEYAVSAMQEYASCVAKQALSDAAKKYATVIITDKTGHKDSVSLGILNTEIKLP